MNDAAACPSLFIFTVTYTDHHHLSHHRTMQGIQLKKTRYEHREIDFLCIFLSQYRETTDNTQLNPKDQTLDQ